MSKRESMARQSLIIKKLRRRPATFAEIQDYLALESEIQEYNFHISSRTFQRDRDDLRAVHGIHISYDFSRKLYYIECDEKREATERILEAFDIQNALNMTDRISAHIQFEKRRPQGTEHLFGLLHAIKNQIQIKFVYHKFWDRDFSERIVEPYALKEFKNRWYVLSKDVSDATLKNFALDRITGLQILKKKFATPMDLDLNERFKHCFGITTPRDQQPEDVVLSFSRFQGEYIKSLPLHGSQQTLIDDDKELKVQLKLYITPDFVMELLSFGENMRVLQPQSLIEKLKTTAANIQRMYQEE